MTRTSDKKDRGDVQQNATLRCKLVLMQTYTDIHAFSLPGSIEAGTEPRQHILFENKNFSASNWFQANISLQTQCIFNVIEYAILGRELHGQNGDIDAAVNSLHLLPDHDLGRTGIVARNEIRLAIRYAEFASTYGYMMLSILATSAAFRDASRTFDEVTWNLFVEIVRANFLSLEYFAKIRGLNWQAALERFPQYQAIIKPFLKENNSLIQVAHPHTYIVPQNRGPLRRPRHKNEDQVNIDRNIFAAASFAKHKSPPFNWPKTKSYPSDPTITNEKCHLCNRKDCACDPFNSNKVTRPLVELVNFGRPKGNGIRVLQKIKTGDILGEYVGEIIHNDEVDDEVYGFSLELVDGAPIAHIGSQFRGNWTRFINHSCDAATEFNKMIIGQRWRVMVVAVKDVDAFDELTVNYGMNYWLHGSMICRCGSSNCLHKNRR